LSELTKLIALTYKKNYNEIKHILESLPSTQKGTIFEKFIEELYKGNGWIATRTGGKKDLGADILLSHPKTPDSILMIIQTKNHNQPLSYDDTRNELRKFEEEASEKYNCNQYGLISINGYVEAAKKYEQFNISLDGWEHVIELIHGYDPKNKVEPDIKLFAHNKIAYENVKEIWRTSNRVAVVQATGTGKSFIIIKLLADFIDKNSIILAPSNYILEQFKSKARWISQQTEFMTYQKTMNLTKDEINELNLSLIVLDEYHRVGAEKWSESVQRIIDAYPQAKILGTSATPIRYLDKSRNMSDELFENQEAVNLSLPEAIVKDILPKPKYISALYTLDEEIEIMTGKINDSNNTQEEKQELLDQIKSFKRSWERSKGIPQILKKHVPSVANKFIVFCKDKEHMNEIDSEVMKWFNKAGFSRKPYWIYSDQGEKANNDTLEEFKNVKNQKIIHLLFTIDMLNEGIHIDDVDGVILLRPTQSPIIFYQQIGRAIQTGIANEPLILDFVNNFRNIGAVNFLNDLSDAHKREMGLRQSLHLADKPFGFIITDEIHEVIELFKSIEDQLIATWKIRYQELLQYKEIHGNCLVPARYDENKALATWVSEQRKYFNRGILQPERIEQLNTIGFNWNPLEHSWEHMYQLLLKYKQEYGDCLVPISFDKKLGYWVQQQRNFYKKQRLSKERIEKLNFLGFTWNPNDELWDKMYQFLKEYKEVNGDCLVKKGHFLSNWVYDQRKAYKKNELSFDKIEKLEEIGFIWDTNEDLWDKMYMELLQFKDRYGSCLVPETYKSLRKWTIRQRELFRNGTLSPEREKKLESVGFLWNPFDDSWNEMYEELVKYKEKHGHCIVTIKENEKLSRWVTFQRVTYKKGNLETSKKSSLDSLGFIWNYAEHSWNEMYKELVNYRERFGNCLVPPRYKDNVSLSIWVGTQRTAYRKGILSTERTERLDKLGFVWDARKSK
jgi:superfamily II DNA or RNA helicase